MAGEDPEMFFNYYRMTPRTFEELLARLRPELQRRPVTGYLSPGERLAVTVRYLASGQDQRYIAFHFLAAPSTISGVIRNGCRGGGGWEELHSEVIPPLCEETWRRVARGFEEEWQFPNCIGALDGKHCAVQGGGGGESNWFNYKESFSMVLLAMCDAQYKFLWVDIGGRGRRGDGGLFFQSTLDEGLRLGTLSVPGPRAPVDGWPALPHVIVGDAAFRMSMYLMTPFEGRFLTDDKNIFNYKLSRARRCIENAFGTMSARWRVLRRTLLASVAVACLHNLLMGNEENLPPDRRRYNPPGYVDREDEEGRIIPGQWREDAGEDVPQDINVGDEEGDEDEGAKEARESFTDYFLGPGSVPWQWRQ
ncbi:hypothetical protein ONE63_009561 [Megalurothrips usitatus]|uniref:DDE Tnp4 domain-containing protein n=1 Tax=Megalurothrips usitatus TaxID=439358 RepID=A0AAV7XNC7_9NEOP|nr:hypothetical protein ONE63_009561 [Megalurothrips usitatus]